MYVRVFAECVPSCRVDFPPKTQYTTPSTHKKENKATAGGGGNENNGYDD